MERWLWQDLSNPDVKVFADRAIDRMKPNLTERSATSKNGYHYVQAQRSSKARFLCLKSAADRRVHLSGRRAPLALSKERSLEAVRL